MYLLNFNAILQCYVDAYKTVADRLLAGTLGHTTETDKSELMRSNLCLAGKLSYLQTSCGHTSNTLCDASYNFIIDRTELAS